MDLENKRELETMIKAMWVNSEATRVILYAIALKLGAEVPAWVAEMHE